MIALSLARCECTVCPVAMSVESSHTDVLAELTAGVCRIQLNRPEALNAWTPQMGRDLLAALRSASEDPTVRAVLITGSGRAFSSGADLKVPREMTDEGLPDLSIRLREIYNPIVLTIARAPKPVVAALNGPAAGLGAALALACDLILAAESSYLMLPFVKLGLIPDAGSAYLLATRIGYGRAVQLAMLGERLPAQRALDWGVVNEVHPDDELAAAAQSFTERLAAGPTVALASMKQALRAGTQRDLEQQLELDATLQQVQAGTADYAEGVASFKEKRPPEFTGS
jgi:2-(1,2-epoxy-1,2-dihydrophenyl)acetyl-CoA isomerase